jgi:hypothetical protein
MNAQLALSPARQKAAEALLEGLSVGGVLVLLGGAGTGKTAILRHIHALRGGALVGVREFVESLLARGPGAVEEAFLRTVEDAMHAHDLVLVDDLHLVTYIVNRYTYARKYLLEAALTALLAEACALRKTILFTASGELPWPVARRAYTFEIG